MTTLMVAAGVYTTTVGVGGGHVPEKDSCDVGVSDVCRSSMEAIFWLEVKWKC
jgi:hypothetical protein